MKRLFVVSCLTGAVLTMAMSTGLAAECWLSDSDWVLESTCFTGLPSDGTGRYVRVDYPGVLSATFCSDARTGADIDKAFGPMLEGTKTYTYSICKDALGTACQTVATPSITMTKQSDGSFKADPQTLIVDFSNYANDYPACKMPR